MTQRQRGRHMQRVIRDALMREWDPIGVADIPEADDEYDRYIGSVYRILTGRRSEEELVEFLYQTETDTMGLVGGSHPHLREVARKLLALDIR